MVTKENVIHRIREFNRFYMPKLGLLDNHYLGSEYTPTEARVLFEIYENDGCNAAYIARTMNIDKSYLSRIIKAYEKNGFIARNVSETDSRAYHIHLTEKGMVRTKELIEKSNQEIDSIIQCLNKDEYAELMEAFHTITAILEKCS